MNEAAPPRRIWLCADDYGISDGVNRAIRDLIGRGRLNATSVMVVGPAIGRDEVAALQDVAAGSPRCAIGLHATLTAPFRPLTMHFRPTDGGMFLPLPAMLRVGPVAAARSRNDPCRIDRSAGGVPGTVRPRAGFRRRPSACATVPAGARRVSARGEAGRARRLGSPGRTRCSRWRSGSARPRRCCSMSSARSFASAPRSAGIPFNPAFAGAYDFSKAPDFGVLMRQFLRGHAGRRARDVPSRLCRRNARQPRSPDHPARTANTRFSPARNCRRCWRANNVTLA